MSREVPEGWALRSFGSIATLHKGLAYTASGYSDRESGMPFAGIKVFNKGGGFERSGLKFYDPTGDKRYIAQPNELLLANTDLTRNGDIIGSAVRVPEDILSLIFSMDVSLVKVELNVADSDFIYHLINSDNLRREMKKRSGGSTVLHLKTKDVPSIDVLLPPLHEQRRIAEILSGVDEVIAATKAVIEQTEKVKQGVLERLLTKGIGHTRFKHTEIGEIPEGWEVVELDDITPPDRKITYGIVQAGPDYAEGVPYIRVSDMGEYQIDEVSVLRTSPEIASKYRRSELQRDDIVFALRGKVGHVLRTPQSLAGANLTQGTARIACGGKILSEFLLWALRSPQSQRQYKREIKGSTFQELTLGSLKKIQVPLPPLEEQLLLAGRIEDVEAGLRSSECSLFSLMAAKSALMSDLLTGRKRVTDTFPLAAE